MTCKDSHFLIGLGIGSIFGALAYWLCPQCKSKKNESRSIRCPAQN